MNSRNVAAITDRPLNLPWRERLARSLFLFVGLTLPATAQLDTQGSGMSDVWQRHFNRDNPGQLFNPEIPDHAPHADPDRDGWTNLEESFAGTDPFSGIPPEGLVVSHVTHLKDQEETPTPEYPDGRLIDVAVISWDTLPGKSYTLHYSPDLTNQSWLPVDLPYYGDGQPAATSITLTDSGGISPDRLFWRVAVEDVDNDNDGLTDHEEIVLGLNPYSSATHSVIPDIWVATHFPNAVATFDPHAYQHGNGLTHLQMFHHGLDPNVEVNSGPVNFNLQEDIIDYPDMSFRNDNPADLYHQESVEGWEAIDGQYIEIWDEGDGRPYFELQAHLESHGVMQEFEMLPETTLDFIIRYKGRYDWSGPYNNGFSLQVEGAYSVLVNGAALAQIGNSHSHAFMGNDSWDKYKDWQHAVVTISAPDATNGMTPITLAFIPDATSANAGNQEVDITHGGFVALVPVEIAPAVLAVNSDFDEGRIDPVTGYAIPDCDDENIALEVVRNHLNGKYAINERVTDDMHPGFFGLKPSDLSNDFWTSANITISKINQLDPATGHPESGHVRFYGKWGNGPSEYRAIVPYDFDSLATTNLAAGGINRVPEESVYGPNSPFPAGTSFFMEGVHPGWITLEWRYQKGDVDIRYKQRFEVCTHKNAFEWKHELAYKIRLETSNDPSGQIHTYPLMFPNESYKVRMERASEYYDFYQDCFLTPMRSKPIHPQAMTWPGLARLAGSQVVGGLSDSEYARRILQAYSIGAYILPSEIEDNFLSWSISETNDLQQALFTGARTIFHSIGWQMHAYRSSGYRALDWVAAETGETEVSTLVQDGVWRDLRIGILNHDKDLLDEVSLLITDREQNVTIVPTWTVISGLFAGTTEWMFSVLGKNSCTPSGDDFSDIYPQFPNSTGSLADTDDRWYWITNLDGVLDTWNKHPQASRDSLVRETLEKDARRFSLVHRIAYASPYQLYLPIWVWDDEDVP